MIKFSEHIDPLPKERARVAQGRAYTPSRTSAYEQEIGYRCLAYMQAHDLYTIVDLVAVKLVFRRKSKVHVDLDNLIKAVLDGLNGIAYQDDHQVREIYAKMTVGHNNDYGLDIEIRSLGNEIQGS